MKACIFGVHTTKEFQQQKFRNAFIARMDGACCRNSADFFSELKLQFELPDYFGNNLDAFYDCMLDLEWIAQEQVILYMENADQLLADEVNDPDLIDDLVTTLDEICQSWLLVENEEFTPKNFKVIFQPISEFKEVLDRNEIVYKLL